MVTGRLPVWQQKKVLLTPDYSQGVGQTLRIAPQTGVELSYAFAPDCNTEVLQPRQQDITGLFSFVQYVASKHPRGDADDALR